MQVLATFVERTVALYHVPYQRTSTFSPASYAKTADERASRMNAARANPPMRAFFICPPLLCVRRAKLAPAMNEVKMIVFIPRII